MKKLLCIMFVVACFNVTPAYAHLNASSEADCNGLTIYGTACANYYYHPGNLLVYTVNVNGEIITGEMWQEVDLDEYACLPFSIDIPLVEMCGDVEISGILEFYGSYKQYNQGSSFDVYEIQERVLECPCYSCPLSLGYWKNHPEAWPLDSIVIADVTLPKKLAMLILWSPIKRSKNINLIKQMIAAILNVASGSDPSINDVIEEANECLASCRCDKDAKEELKNILDVYNNGEDCH